MPINTPAAHGDNRAHSLLYTHSGRKRRPRKYGTLSKYSYRYCKDTGGDTFARIGHAGVYRV